KSCGLTAADWRARLGRPLAGRKDGLRGCGKRQEQAGEESGSKTIVHRSGPWWRETKDGAQVGPFSDALAVIEPEFTSHASLMICRPGYRELELAEIMCIASAQRLSLTPRLPRLRIAGGKERGRIAHEGREPQIVPDALEDDPHRHPDPHGVRRRRAERRIHADALVELDGD